MMLPVCIFSNAVTTNPLLLSIKKLVLVVKQGIDKKQWQKGLIRNNEILISSDRDMYIIQELHSVSDS